MNTKKLVGAVLALLLLPLLSSQSSAQVEFTVQNQVEGYIDITIEATGVGATYVSDSQGEDFFPDRLTQVGDDEFFDGRGQFFATRLHALTSDEGIFLGGVPLLNLSFASSGTQNTIYFGFNSSVPVGSDLSDLNGTYSFLICTSCEYSFEPGTYQVEFESGIDFGDVVVNALPIGNMGDVNGDRAVNFFDVSPFIELLTTGRYRLRADINQDGEVNFLDIVPFIKILSS